MKSLCYNKTMRIMKKKTGFSLVEVMLFIAISAAIVVSIMIATKNSIEQQRYNDTVQGFTEFLRNIYSDTANVQINGKKSETGRSNYAIYGKLVTFGNFIVDEKGILSATDKSGGEGISVYDIMGDASGMVGSSASVLESLKLAKAQYACELVKKDNNFVCKADELTGKVLVKPSSTYTSNWDARIETTDKENKVFTGALLVVRSPSSGVTYTFTISDKAITQATVGGKTLTFSELLNNFTNEDMDFCISLEGLRVYNGLRRNIRIKGSGHSSTAVELIPLDETGQFGNRCQ